VSTQIVDLLTAALEHEELLNPHVVALVARSRDLADQITDALDPGSDASTEDVHRAVFAISPTISASPSSPASCITSFRTLRRYTSRDRPARMAVAGTRKTLR
jgi:hypothetical protein